MLRLLLAAAFAAAMIATSMAPAFAQSKTEKAKTEKAQKAEKKSAKKPTPQQAKMKDCGAKWQTYKKENNVKGQAEYRKFLKTCLKA
jgi:Ni/Co efflux regulator RcnB